jgi:hypothetical protein
MDEAHVRKPSEGITSLRSLALEILNTLQGHTSTYFVVNYRSTSTDLGSKDRVFMLV